MSANAFRSSLTFGVYLLTITLSVTGCSPKYDWRNVTGGEAPYTVLMPGKPSRLSQEIKLGQQTVTMHMTAARIDNIRFAVGAVKLSDATEAQAAIPLIKNALLKNMAGIITQEKMIATTVAGQPTVNDDFSALNAASSLRMSGRLVARGVWVFEVLVVRPDPAINQQEVEEATDTFLSSFKPIV